MGQIKLMGIYIDEAVFTTKFSCDYKQCKGGCCWAPSDDPDIDGGQLTEDEAIEISKKYQLMQKFMERTHKEPHHYSGRTIHTSLCKDGGCVFSNRNEGTCAIRSANKAGLINFPIPVHCSLYPLTLDGNQLYMSDIWENLCGPAFIKGEEENMPAFRFVKDSLIRLFGEPFFNGLDNYYNQTYGK